MQAGNHTSRQHHKIRQPARETYMQRRVDPTPSFDTPIAMLLACHGQIRRFVSMCLRLEQHLAQKGLNDEAGTAAQNVLRYFNIAAPLHHADEEEDVFPALRTLADLELNARIDALESEHGRLTVLWHGLQSWLEATAALQVSPQPPGLHSFVHTYLAHAEREEREIFPAAQRLSPEQLTAIGNRMRARRQPNPASGLS